MDEKGQNPNVDIFLKVQSNAKQTNKQVNKKLYIAEWTQSLFTVLFIDANDLGINEYVLVAYTVEGLSYFSLL